MAWQGPIRSAPPPRRVHATIWKYCGFVFYPISVVVVWLWQTSELLNGRSGAYISHMNNPSIDDIDKPGGWLFRVRTPPDLARTFYVYELDQSVAIALLKEKLTLSPNETIEAVAQANIHSLTGLGMKPGDVLQHG
jgi:hypothetical protein